MAGLKNCHFDEQTNRFMGLAGRLAYKLTLLKK